MRKGWILMLTACSLLAGPVVGSSANVLPGGKFMTEYHITLAEKGSTGRLELYYGYLSRATMRLRVYHTLYDSSFNFEITKYTIDTKINIIPIPRFSCFIGASLKEFAPFGGLLFSFVPARIGIHLCAYGTNLIDNPSLGAQASIEYRAFPGINLFLEGVYGYKEKRGKFEPWLSCQIKLPVTIEVAGLLDKDDPKLFAGGYIVW